MKKGFSLIELIIIIGMIGLFSGLVIAAYNTYTQQLQLRGDVRKISGMLELARKKAVASDIANTGCSDFQGYRVILEASRYSLLLNCAGVYQTIQSSDLESSNTIIVGLGNFDFPPGGINTGITINQINVQNANLNGSNKCMDISINQIGVINISDSFNSCT